MQKMSDIEVAPSLSLQSFMTPIIKLPRNYFPWLHISWHVATQATSMQIFY